MPSNLDLFLTTLVGKIEALSLRMKSYEKTEMSRLNDDGWMRDPYTWIYASANSFTVTTSIDVSTIFCVGTKLRCKQGGAYKYFYVSEVSAVYLGGDSFETTATITGGSDYSLTNAVITNNSYSYLVTPIGFPQWFNWTPALEGFSVDPANGIYRFSVLGRNCICMVRMPSNGTSDDTIFTLTVPIVSVTLTDMRWHCPASVIDNGTNPGTPGLAYLESNSDLVTIQKDYATGTWTNSGEKSANFLLTYEI